MVNKRKKLYRLAALVVAMLLLPVTAAPARAEQSPEEGESEPMIVLEPNNRTSGTVPTVYYNLGANTYTATFHDLEINQIANTQRYFTTSSGEIHLRCSVWSTGETDYANRYMTVELYKKSTGSWELEASKAVRATSSTALLSLVDFENLEMNAFYYIRVINKTPGDTSDDRTVSGTIVITD